MAAAIALASCSSPTRAPVVAVRAVSTITAAPTTSSSVPRSPQRATRSRPAGASQRRTPAAVAGPVGSYQSARASWYSSAETNGHRTASGERLDDGALTFAHKTMRFGTTVEFCRAGRCITARCTDRGPFVAGRSFDLTRAAFSALAPLGAGVITVDWRVL